MSEGHAATKPSAIHLHPYHHAEHSLVGKEFGESHRQPSETAPDIDYRNLTRFPAERTASFDWCGRGGGGGRGGVLKKGKKATCTKEFFFHIVHPTEGIE